MEEASHGKRNVPVVGRRCIKLVVGGLTFHAFNTSLWKIPQSRLSMLTPHGPEYDGTLDAYVYDRNSTIFSYILSAYTSGNLHLPHDLCARAIKEELDFWQISTDLLSGCCYRRYRQSEVVLQTLARVEKSIKDEAAVELCQSTNILIRIYRLLSHPRSSIPALIWYIVYSILLLTSCSLLILETLPEFKVYRLVNMTAGMTAETMEIELTEDDPIYKIIFVILIFAIFFIFEWIIRFVTCPAKVTFLKSFINLNDIMSTFLMLILLTVGQVTTIHSVLGGIITVLYFLRTLRLLQLLSDWRRANVILITIRDSILDLLPLLIAIFTGMLVSSALVFYSEATAVDSHFRSIPDAFWWSIVTVTTVGYGDMRPISGLGKTMGSFWALAGMFFIGLPVPIFVHNFARANAMCDLRDDILEKAGVLKKSRGKVLMRPPQ